MNWVDVTILTALITGTGLGLFWGLLRQIASTFGLVLAIFLAGNWYKGVAGFLYNDGSGLINSENMANIVAFALIVVGVSLTIGIVVSILRTVLGLLFLGWLDHLLGALLGLVQMLLLLAVIIIAATVFPVPGLSDAVQQSNLAPLVAQPLSFIVDWLPPEFQAFRFLANFNR